MKILHVITDLTLGGAETVLCRLVSRMNSSVFQSQVICLGEGGPLAQEIQRSGIEVHAANRSLRRLHQTTARVQPDLIQGWMYHGNVASFLESYLFRTRVPVLWNIRHSLHDLQAEKKSIAILIRLGAWLSFRPATIIYNSHVSAVHHQNLGYRKKHALVIPNGFDCAEFLPSTEARVSVRKELEIPEEGLLIGLFARYHPVKGHNHFLNAASILIRSGFPAYFILAGKGADKENPKLVKEIGEAGLSGRIRCLGERKDVPQLTAALDIAVCSSLSESFPNVIGEAMACEVACVCTDVGDAAALMGNTGKIIPPGSPEALAQACREWIEMGPGGRKAAGALARQRIRERFSIEHMVRSYEDLYRRFLPAV